MRHQPGNVRHCPFCPDGTCGFIAASRHPSPTRLTGISCPERNFGPTVVTCAPGLTSCAAMTGLSPCGTRPGRCPHRGQHRQQHPRLWRQLKLVPCPGSEGFAMLWYRAVHPHAAGVAHGCQCPQLCLGLTAAAHDAHSLGVRPGEHIGGEAHSAPVRRTPSSSPTTTPASIPS